MGEQARGPSDSAGVKASVLISLLVFQPAPAGDLGPSAAVATHRSSPWVLPAYPYSPAGLRGCASPPCCPPSPAFAPRAHLHLRCDLSLQAHPLGWPPRAKPPGGCVPCTWVKEAFGEGCWPRKQGPLVGSRRSLQLAEPILVLMSQVAVAGCLLPGHIKYPDWMMKGSGLRPLQRALQVF